MRASCRASSSLVAPPPPPPLGRGRCVICASQPTASLSAPPSVDCRAADAAERPCSARSAMCARRISSATSE
eukprot:2271736-Prymnesium_polylepis.1